MLDKIIKSAYETAMERFSQRKEVPRSEIEKMENISLGKTIAAKFLRENNYDILAEINKHPDNIKEYLAEGAQETFLGNISLPTEKPDLDTNKIAMEGLLAIKKNKPAVVEIFSQLEHLFVYYDQTLAQAYSQFKDSYAAKISDTVKTLEKRAGTKLKIDIEKQPGFREEWIKYLSRLNSQYEGILAEQKDKLRQIK